MPTTPPTGPRSTEEGSLSYPGWRIAFVCFLIAVFGWGYGFYGQGIYLAELKRLHGWPTSTISAITTGYYSSARFWSCSSAT